MQKTFRKLLILLLGAIVFIGLPLLFKSTWLLFISWMPAMFVMIYLDEAIDE